MMQPDSRPTSPIVNADARCRRCEYNLRGLGGDPVVCPECGLPNSLAELLDLYSERRRLNELRGAGDALILAALAIIGAALLQTLRRDPTLGLLVTLIGGLLAFLGIRTCRRILPDAADWPAAFSRYVALTVSIPLVPLGIALGCAILAWKARAGSAQDPTRTTLDAIDFLAGLAPTGLILYFVRPLRRLRRLQRRAFVQLRRLVRHRTR